MLSAVMQRLRDIKSAKSPERQLATVDLCNKAYPDLRPWQVKKECDEISGPARISGDDNDVSDLYYTYLCQLLHPIEGHDGARHDPALVAEYCILSVKGKAGKRRNNFLHVASRTSSDHLAYSRDLPFLLKLSMETREFDLALDLGEFFVAFLAFCDSLPNACLLLKLLRSSTQIQTLIRKNHFVC